MAFEQIFTSIVSSLPMFIIKLFAIALLILHLGFSIVIVRQTKLMIRVVEAQISPVIYMISVLHLISSVLLLVWVMLFL